MPNFRHAQIRGATRPWLSSAVLVASLQIPGAAQAHEFWLDMVDFKPKVSQSVPIVFRNGEKFLGDSYPYLRKGARRFTVVDSRGEHRVKAIEGDDPAAEFTFAAPGLAIVVYQGAPEEVDFDTFAKFEASLRNEGLDHIVEAHRKAGKPEMKIKESYARCTKALVKVGPGQGGDKAVGLPLEIVAERNPYLLTPGEGLPVRVLHVGRPLPGATVRVFNRADPQSPRSVKTDAEGRAVAELPLPGEYLLNAVHMLEPAKGEKAHWSSLWASLTFARP